MEDLIGCKGNLVLAITGFETVASAWNIFSTASFWVFPAIVMAFTAFITGATALFTAVTVEITGLTETIMVVTALIMVGFLGWEFFAGNGFFGVFVWWWVL